MTGAAIAMLPDDVAYDRAHGCSCATDLNASREGHARHRELQAPVQPLAGFAPGLHYRNIGLIIYSSQTKFQAGPRRCWRFRGRRGRGRGRRLHLVPDEKSDDV